MIKYNLLSLILLTAAVFSCDNKKNAEETLFTFNGAILKEQYQPNDKVSLEILNPENKAIDSIIYYVNDVNIGSAKTPGKVIFDLKGKKLGYQNLKALVYFEGKNVEITDRVELVTDIQPKLMKYTVVNTYPHATSSFTEGLEFYRDTLFEGTGLRGKSKLLKIDYKTGKIIKAHDLATQYFGEGITVINGKIFQLTYEENTGFIYNADTWKLEKTFTYDKKIEGWGMTNDGKYIYQSDGTEKIWKMDPGTQKMVDYINVYTSGTKIKSVNELELINGKIYGNIWQKDAIAIIDPETGAVEGVLNLADLRKQVKNPEAEVLNGIAYNPKTKTIFVTGKNWDTLFEIRVTE